MNFVSKVAALLIMIIFVASMRSEGLSGQKQVQVVKVNLEDLDWYFK